MTSYLQRTKKAKLNPYEKHDSEEWRNPLSMQDSELRDILQKIWINRNFLNKKDIDKLQHFAVKGLD